MTQQPAPAEHPLTRDKALALLRLSKESVKETWIEGVKVPMIPFIRHRQRYADRWRALGVRLLFATDRGRSGYLILNR